MNRFDVSLHMKPFFERKWNKRNVILKTVTKNSKFVISFDKLARIFRVLHTRYWKNKPGHQHSKLFLIEPLGAASRKILNMSKKRLRLLVGTVSGHYTCNNHLFNIGLSTSRICNRCETGSETMYHLVCLCPTLAKRRLRILGGCVVDLEEIRLVSLKKIVDFLTPLFLDTGSSLE